MGKFFIRAIFVDNKKPDAGGQIFFGLAVVVHPAFAASLVAPDAVVQAFDGKVVLLPWTWFWPQKILAEGW